MLASVAGNHFPVVAWPLLQDTPAEKGPSFLTRPSRTPGLLPGHVPACQPVPGTRKQGALLAGLGHMFMNQGVEQPPNLRD